MTPVKYLDQTPRLAQMSLKLLSVAFWGQVSLNAFYREFHEDDAYKRDCAAFKVTSAFLMHKNASSFHRRYELIYFFHLNCHHFKPTCVPDSPWGATGPTCWWSWSTTSGSTPSSSLRSTARRGWSGSARSPAVRPLILIYYYYLMHELCVSDLIWTYIKRFSTISNFHSFFSSRR